MEISLFFLIDLNINDKIVNKIATKSLIFSNVSVSSHSANPVHRGIRRSISFFNIRINGNYSSVIKSINVKPAIYVSTTYSFAIFMTRTKQDNQSLRALSRGEMI